MMRPWPMGYGETYRGSVVDNADPEQQNRLLVLVPEIFGNDSVWAEPSASPRRRPDPGDR